MSLIRRGKSRPFSFQLLTDRLLTLHALLKSLNFVPLSNTRIRGLIGNSRANWPHIERRNPIDRVQAIEGTRVNIVTRQTQ